MVVLGIDIGGSATKGALVDTETGELTSDRLRIGYKTVQTPAEIIAHIVKIKKDLGYDGPIGAGFPGVVRHGVIRTSANLHKGWIGADLLTMIRQATGQQTVSVINDADAAGLAEIRFGIKRDVSKSTVMFLTLGTGIGSAIFTNGQLMPNTEFGHLQIRGKDAETRASAAAKRIGKYTWKQWAVRLDEVLHVYEFLLGPDLFILGGGISPRFDKFSRYLTVDTEVIPAVLENTAGIIGAAMAVHEDLT